MFDPVFLISGILLHFCRENNRRKNEGIHAQQVFSLFNYTRVMYSPVRVSTRMVSPTLTKFGHCTTTPVSVVTFFVTPVAVSPRIAISASTTFKSTEVGNSTSMGLSL